MDGHSFVHSPHIRIHFNLFAAWSTMDVWTRTRYSHRPVSRAVCDHLSYMRYSFSADKILMLICLFSTYSSFRLCSTDSNRPGGRGGAFERDRSTKYIKIKLFIVNSPT